MPSGWVDQSCEPLSLTAVSVIGKATVPYLGFRVTFTSVSILEASCRASITQPRLTARASITCSYRGSNTLGRVSLSPLERVSLSPD